MWTRSDSTSSRALVTAAAGTLPARLLPVELAAAVHVLAGLRDGAGERRDEADPHGALGGRIPRGAEQEGEGDNRDQHAHGLLLPRPVTREGRTAKSSGSSRAWPPCLPPAWGARSGSPRPGFSGGARGHRRC